jgi:glycosyltransferase involved in cell wall biosynthesis
MRVLYWTERFCPHIGGIETMSEHIIPALTAMGHSIQVVTSHSAANLPDEDNFNGIPVRRLDFLTALTNRDMKTMIEVRQRLSRLKQQFKPNVVHIHFSGPSSLFHHQTHHAHPAPTLVTLHSIPPQPRQKNSLLLDTLHAADWVSAVSRNILKIAHDRAPSIAPRSSVIYNGQPPLEAAFTAPPAEPRLLCLGRLVEWKGFDRALYALKQLQLLYPNLRLTIAGDGPHLSALQTLTAQLGVEGQVEFLGWVKRENIVDLVRHHTLTLIPSCEEENLPMVALEAAQAGRPVIASRVSGLPEIVDDGVSGILVESGDIDALAGAISYLVSQPQQAERMGRNASAFVAQKFSLEQCASAYDALYRKIATHAASN